MRHRDYPDVLTKENFWNDLVLKYPEQMNTFMVWIDEYKARVNWGSLFNRNIHHPLSEATLTPKFHELPTAMQIGIFFEFTTEHKSVGINDLFDDGGVYTMKQFITNIEMWFKMQNQIES